METQQNHPEFKASTPAVRRTNTEYEGGSALIITNKMLDSVQSIGSWSRFFSVLGFISVFFMVFGGLAMMLGGLLGGTFTELAGSTPLLMVMAIIYIILGLVYVFPSYFLWQTASAAAKIREGLVIQGMEEALGRQKSFWKIVGTLTICILSLYALSIFVIIALAVIKSLS